jgi:hypothetical protein
MRFIVCACLALTAAALRPLPVATLRTPAIQQRSSVPVAQQQQLPPGWYTTQDPNTGQTYYCDGTGQCQWDPPQANQGLSQLPPGWYTTQDPNTGQTYYCNEATGQCQWDPPQR